MNNRDKKVNTNFSEKKALVEDNLRENEKHWKGFNETLENLIKKANALPVKEKIGFTNLKYDQKENRYGLLTTVISGSNHIYSKSLFNLIFNSKGKKQKQYRTAFIRVSDKFDQFDIELKEDLLKKVKEKIDGHVNHGVESYKGEKTKFNKSTSIRFKDIDRELYDTILGWISFKYTTEKMLNNLSARD